MNETTNFEAADAVTRDRQCARAWRNMAAAIVVGLVNVFLTFDVIPRFAAIFHDMLQPDLPLPVVTRMVLHGQWGFVALAAFWPLVAIREFRRRWEWFSFALIAITAVEVLFTCEALVIPLNRIISRMGGAG